MLIVKYVIRKDVGEYIIIVINSFGIKEEYVKVLVFDVFGFLGFIEISNVLVEKVIFIWIFFLEDGGLSIKVYVFEKREISRFLWIVVFEDI